MGTNDLQQDDGSARFYFADGKKVYLQASTRYMAVKTPDDDVARKRAFAALNSALTAAGGGADTISIPQYSLAVVDLGRAQVASRSSLRGAASATTDVQAGPPVYVPVDAPSAESLIPVGEVLVRFKDSVSEAERTAALAPFEATIAEANYPEPGSYLIKVPAERDALQAANELHEDARVQWAHPNFVRLMPRLTGVNGSQQIELKSPSAHDVPLHLLMPQEIEERLAKPALVDAGDVAPSLTPTDPSFASQWALRKIRAPEAWDVTTGSAAVSVAVIDEGCNLTHEDLTYKLPGYDAVHRTDNPEPLPADGHGTACAGIVAARLNNGKGGVGVAPGCKILPVRIAYGTSGGWFTTDAIIADGIRTAVNRGADVLSNSWGGGGPSTAITSAFSFAQTNGRGGRGCPIAIATGNDDLRGVHYPASLSPTIPGLLAVGASNEWDQRKSKTSLDGENWWGSNFGPEVDVVAPGVHIFTSDIMGAAGYSSGNYVPNFNGTSSATPHVAGLMALLLSLDPDLRSWEVEDIIKLSARELGAAGRDEEFGFGRIDSRRALEAAARLGFSAGVTPVFIGSGRECFIRVNARVYNPGINWVRLDSLSIASHTPDWSSVVDRFDFAASPGGVMAPRSSADVKLSNILLRANGTQSSYQYRWSASWSYTFWRPSAAAFPFDGSSPQGPGQTVKSGLQRGGRDGGSGQSRQAAADNGIGERGAAQGKTVSIDRETGTVTIVIR